MAEKPVKVITQENGITVVTWADLDNGDTGKPISLPPYIDMAVQRTAGAGTIALQGSNDGTTFGALGAGVAPDGTIKQFAERPLFIRPSATVSDDNTVVLVLSSPGL